jgi:hypothetical protein
MPAAKWIVLVAGVVGLTAFFVPLARIEHRGVVVPITALDVVRGVDERADEVATSDLPAADKAEVDDTLTELKGVVLACFAPAAVLVLIGGIGAARRRLGRIGGTLAVLVGGVGALIWYGLATGAADAGPGAEGGFGLHLLLLSALGGIAGGMMAAVRPDATARRTPAA